MRRRTWSREPEERPLRDVIGRRMGWILEGMTPRKFLNVAACVAQYSFRSERLLGWPIILKIDISPLCNLRCPTCVHGDPRGNPRLQDQSFRADQWMRLDQFEDIISEIRGKSTAVSLYYLGDPLMHPHLCEMCRIAREAHLNVHLCTSFSFTLTDDQVRELVKSGITHLTVCVDGLSQAKYELTRAGGHADWVLSNLERTCLFRRDRRQAHPRVEVQYIMFRHNVEELEPAARRFEALGVDEVTAFWGALHNYTDLDPGTYKVYGPRRRRALPWCYWPYLFMLIKYNGDVIPCCNHRVGAQYSAATDPRVIGNVFETSVRQVWNSREYRELRRLALNPGLIRSNEALESAFCNECPRLFNTSRDENLRSGHVYAFEDLYRVGENGVTRRLRVPEN